MPAVPRIYRVTPQGHVTLAATPIEIVVAMRWRTREQHISEVRGVAVAWTRTEVELE